MPWHLKKEAVTPTDGGTGAASSEAYAAVRSQKVSLHLREEGSDQDIAVVRLDSSRRCTRIISPAGEKEVFSIEDLNAALKGEGLESISRKTYEQIYGNIT